MTQAIEKWNYHILSRQDFLMVWRCHGIPCFQFYFCFRTNVRKRYFNESGFRHCYGNFFESAILKLTWSQLCSHTQSSFSTISRHIDNSISKKTLQLKILRMWMKIRANSFTRLEHQTSQNEIQRRHHEDYHLPKNVSLHFKEHCTKVDDISLTSFFFSQTNLALKSIPVFFDILDSFCYILFTFFPFEYWYFTVFEVHPVPLRLFYKKQ